MKDRNLNSNLNFIVNNINSNNNNNLVNYKSNKLRPVSTNLNMKYKSNLEETLNMLNSNFKDKHLKTKVNENLQILKLNLLVNKADSFDKLNNINNINTNNIDIKSISNSPFINENIKNKLNDLYNLSFKSNSKFNNKINSNLNTLYTDHIESKINYNNNNNNNFLKKKNEILDLLNSNKNKNKKTDDLNHKLNNDIILKEINDNFDFSGLSTIKNSIKDYNTKSTSSIDFDLNKRSNSDFNKMTNNSAKSKDNNTKLNDLRNELELMLNSNKENCKTSDVNDLSNKKDADFDFKELLLQNKINAGANYINNSNDNNDNKVGGIDSKTDNQLNIDELDDIVVMQETTKNEKQN